MGRNVAAILSFITRCPSFPPSCSWTVPKNGLSPRLNKGNAFVSIRSTTHRKQRTSLGSFVNELPYIYVPLWGTGLSRPIPRVIEKGTMLLSEIPNGSGIYSPWNNSARIEIVFNSGQASRYTLYFWKSRGKNIKGQIGVDIIEAWTKGSSDRRFFDSVEAAVAYAKIKGWLI